MTKDFWEERISSGQRKGSLFWYLWEKRISSYTNKIGLKAYYSKVQSNNEDVEDSLVGNIVCQRAKMKWN